jgi:hypothetical protein
MLIGKKGKYLEPGYIFTPYVMATSVSIIEDRNSRRKNKIRKLLELPIDNDFKPSKSITSRYATKKVNNNFYKTIDIKKPLN